MALARSISYFNLREERVEEWKYSFLHNNSSMSYDDIDEIAWNIVDMEHENVREKSFKIRSDYNVRLVRGNYGAIGFIGGITYEGIIDSDLGKETLGVLVAKEVISPFSRN